MPKDPDPDKNFDNQMIVCIDGREVIRVYSSLTAHDESRENRVMSEIAQKKLTKYQQELSNFLELADREQISAETLLAINEVLPDVKAIKKWLAEPEI